MNLICDIEVNSCNKYYEKSFIYKLPDCEYRWNN